MPPIFPGFLIATAAFGAIADGSYLPDGNHRYAVEQISGIFVIAPRSGRVADAPRDARLGSAVRIDTALVGDTQHAPR